MIETILIVTIAGLALLGMIIALSPPRRGAKGIVFATFVLLFVLSVTLQILQNRENDRRFFGDPEKPTYYDVIGLNPETDWGQRVLVNPSEYPAYGVIVFERAANYRGPAVGTEPKDVPPKGMVTIGTMSGFDSAARVPESPGAMSYNIVVSSRRGPVHEQLLFRRLSDNKWTKALRIIDPPFEQIDEDFPRNVSGGIDWPEFPVFP
jgi:hypothetical protein